MSRRCQLSTSIFFNPLNPNLPQHSDDEAIAQAAALWGGSANPYGVFMQGVREVVARHRDAEAVVTIAETPSGLFAYGVNLRSYNFGFGYASSVWSQAFASSSEAMQAGIREILEELEQAHPDGKSAEEELRRLRKQLEARLKPQQRSLFD